MRTKEKRGVSCRCAIDPRSVRRTWRYREREVLLPCRNVYSASDPRFAHLIELPEQSVQGCPLVIEASRLGNQINS